MLSENTVLYELRVLTGLHRGALLPLAGTQWLIGSSSSADLLLQDPGIEERHCQISRTETGWQIEPLQGALSDEEGHRIDRVQDLASGSPISLNGIWLCVEEAGQAWTGEENILPQQNAKPAPARPEEKKARHRNIFSGSICLALALGVFTSANVWNEEDQYQQPDTCTQEQQKIVLTSVSEAREILTSMFKETGLSPYTRVDINNGEVIISQVREKKRLEETKRLLLTFDKKYQSDVQIALNITESLSSLPFHVAQIIKGENPYLLTDDGRRIFINDEVNGIHLVDITDHKLIFQGETIFEVSW